MGHRRRRRIETDRLVEAYLTAYEHVVEAGFGAEIDWQEQQCIDAVTETDFLRETAWVILSAGMRESVIRDRFACVSDAFLEWTSARAIVRSKERCIQRGLYAFNHQGKIRAIGDVAAFVETTGFYTFVESLRVDGLSELQRLPFIGPVTRYHLAKNLGLDVVKPDRHLVRIAEAAGFIDPDTMCRQIAAVTGDRLATIDVVLWRYATIRPAYRNLFDFGRACVRSKDQIESCAA